MAKAKSNRMNFIARQGLTLDYQHIALIFGAWVLFLAVITGIFHLRCLYIKHSLKASKEHLAALMQDQERRLAMLELAGPKISTAAQQNLIAIFQNPMCWSCVLSELKRAVPPTVKLTHVKSGSESQGGRLHISLDGEASSMRAVLDLVQRLKKSPMFGDVALIEAKTDEKNTLKVVLSIEASVLNFGI